MSKPTAITGLRTKHSLAAWKVLLPAVACLAIILAVALPQLMKPPVPSGAPDSSSNSNIGAFTPPANGNDSSIDSSSSFLYEGQGKIDPADIVDQISTDLNTFRGLPTRDYTWDEGGGKGMSGIREAITSLQQLMYWSYRYDTALHYSHSFAIVKVIDVERYTDTDTDYYKMYGPTEAQSAEAEVMLVAFGAGLDTPIKINQHLYGGCLNDEETNLLRKGGVYVLPLAKEQDWDYWNIDFDLDVLFEVDDNGLVHSHSRFGQLNKYDGKPLDELWHDIEYLYAHPLLTSWLAVYIGNGFDVEFVGDTVRVIYPGSEWTDLDAEGFSAKFDAEGKLALAEESYNIFRIAEGMAKDELIAAISKIRQYLGLEDTALEPTTPLPTTVSPDLQPTTTAISDPQTTAAPLPTITMSEPQTTTTAITEQLPTTAPLPTATMPEP